MLREMLGIAEGILQTLHDDHREVDSLIDSMMDSRDATERNRLFDEMRPKLLAHLKAEQEVLYDRLAIGQSKSRGFAHEGRNEHDLIEQQLQKMSGTAAKAGEAWSAELKVLQELIEQHVNAEESTGFGRARDEFSKEQLEAMAIEFQMRKADLVTQVA